MASNRPEITFSWKDYTRKGYSFHRLAPEIDRFTGTAVLIHGWGVRSSAMTAMGYFLCRRGYEVFLYDYPTSALHIPDHGKRFLEVLRSEADLQGKKCHFLTHSMGGLVLRYALGSMTEAELFSIESIVMLGPPNRGSFLACAGKIPLLGTWNRSLGDMVPRSRTLQIPGPVFLPPVGIIAGRFDEKVSLASTALPDGMDFERIVVKSTHPALRNPACSGKDVVRFFRNKHF